VALVGVREDAGESAAIVFEVFAGTRKLYTSPPLTKYSTPVGIDVRIPGRTKELRLVTSGSSSEGHHWAGWVNAGFPMREETPRIGYVTLPVPGFDPSKYEVAVFAVNGGRVPGVRLATPEEGKIDQLFFGGQGWLTYYAYLVPKDKVEPGPQDWLPNAGLVLETRRVDKSRQRACEDLPGLVKVWNESDQIIGRSFVAGIHHGFPVHPRLLEIGNDAAKNSLALYRYTGFFEADRAGEYFATASNWARACSSMTSWSSVGPKSQLSGGITRETGRWSCSRGSTSWTTSTIAWARCSRWPPGNLRAASSA
jgi:hypothetical protein